LKRMKKIIKRFYKTKYFNANCMGPEFQSLRIRHYGSVPGPTN
jgi:hypothetical protein